MNRLTTNILSEEVLSKLDFETFISFGGEKEKLIKTLNEIYQHHPICFNKTNKGDLSFLRNIIESKTDILKFN